MKAGNVPVDPRNFENYWGTTAINRFRFEAGVGLGIGLASSAGNAGRQLKIGAGGGKNLGNFNASGKRPVLTNTSNGRQNYTKNMDFHKFRSKYGHLFRGRFSGKGQYMKEIAKAWRQAADWGL